MADGGHSERHVALLVEDEADMAAEVGELLEVLGYDYLHASTKQEAMRLADEGHFCFVVLDLQIKLNADSIKPRVEAGQHLLEYIRGLYPCRNAAGQHCMQILVMSGHAKDHHYVVEAFQNEANDFLLKPLSDNKTPFGDKIRDALRRSQRERHEDCHTVLLNAKSTGPATPVAAPRARLTVTSARHGERVEVRVDERSAHISPSPFEILLHLLAGRFRDGEGWVHRHDMGGTAEQGWKGMSRLNEQLGPAMPDGVRFYENDGKGQYRLHADVEVVHVDCAGLATFVGAGAAGELVTELAALIEKSAT